jgi:glycosyltransferase involved in cell wall biosynthesis
MVLRILLDARHVRDFGFGTYIRNLVRGLAGLETTHRFLLTCHRKDQHEFDGLPENFQLLFYERSDAHPFDEIAFPMFVRGLRPDLIHVPLSLVPALLPQPYVVTVHDLSGLIFDNLPGWRHELRRMRMRRGMMRAACVLAVSEATRADVEQLLNVPAQKIRRIYGAADPTFTHRAPGRGARAAGPEAWERERRRILERYQINYPFLLYAGTIQPQKNIPRLVEAFALLRGELEGHPLYKQLRLIIIGDEISRYPSVRKAVIQSRVEPVVRFLGFVPLDTLRIFYEAASAFVFPSLYEGFGLPPLEAMASGTPVICSNVTSLPEVVGDAAYVVSPDNVFDIARGMKEVLLDEGLRKTLVAKGLEQSRRFRWEETARQVLDTYVEVCLDPKSRPARRGAAGDHRS